MSQILIRLGYGSIFHMKCRAVLRLAITPVVEAGSGDVGVTQPILNFGNICLVRESVGYGRCAQ
jgi:hypothetical protein